MTVFTCADTFEAMMTCVYDAWASRLGHANVRLQTEPVFQQELFCDYIPVKADPEKAGKVAFAIRSRISCEAWRQVYLAAMSCGEDRLDVIYRFLILGFARGGCALEMLSAPPVMRLLELSRRAGHEADHFREFVRFVSLGGQAYAAHLEPKCNITSVLAEYFADRMPSEHWLLIDDRRRIAAVHPKDEAFYMTVLSGEDLAGLREAEAGEDRYPALWKEFFRAVGIAERRNEKCQQNLLPLRFRPHMTEFIP